DLTSSTVPQNPGVVDVEVCTVTSCSPASLLSKPVDQFFLYPPGDPKITSIAPAQGPASGGTIVTITGENLGCVTQVVFGSVLATKVSNKTALLDCGSTTTVHVTAPPGKWRSSVRVRLMTAESDFTGFGLSTGTVRFKYTHPVKQRLTVKNVGGGEGMVTSSPRGVTCGLGCSHLFDYGSTVKLTATAAEGSRFVGWSG